VTVVVKALASTIRRAIGIGLAAAVVVAALPGAAHAVPARRISISDVTVAENGGAAALSVAYSGPNASITVDYSTVNGTAVAGADYTASNGTVTLVKGGCKCGTVTVPILNDATHEPPEAFLVNLSNPSIGELRDPQGQATISNDDPAPTFSIDDVTVSEGDTGTTTATFTVTKSGSTALPASVDLATTDVTATAGSDYVATLGTLSFSAADATRTIQVTVNGDVLAEASETFRVDLSNATNATIADGQGTGTIQNDEDVPLASVNDVTVSEAAGTVTFTIALSKQSTQPVTVDHATADGTAAAGSDYTSVSGTTTFAPGDTGELVLVPITNDAVYENDEGLTLELFNITNGLIQDGSGAGTVTNDDAAPTFSIDDVTIAEGDAGTTTATFTVTKSGATALAASVDHVTADATATATLDYVATSGTLSFTPGDATKTIDVTVNGDLVDEIHETFRVNLSNPSNATIADAQGVGTIQNDEDVSLASVDDVTVSEAAGTATFTITLSMPNALPVTVDHSTADGTASGGSDFTSMSGTTTFAPGDTSEPVVVPITDDVAYEYDEDYTLDLSNITNGLTQDGSGTGSIANDDAAPTLAIDDVDVTEKTGSDATATFTVTETGATEVDAVIGWATVDGTAAAGADYTAIGGTLTLGPAQTSQTIQVSVTGDAVDEPAETVSVTLSNPVDATLADAIGTGTIFDDDKTPTVITLKVVKTPSLVKAKGRLEPAVSGMKVKVTLFRKVNGVFKRVGRKTAPLQGLMDRDGDGLNEGLYTASFAKGPKGTYKCVARYAGNAIYLPAKKGKTFTI